VPDPDDDAVLLAEQRRFYQADAPTFDAWLSSLLDESNDEPVAVTYRDGRSRLAEVFAQRAPLGHLLEIAAGTGRLAQLHLPHVASAVLLDSSSDSLTIAGARLAPAERCTLVEADVFAWDAPARTFDTVVFSAWLHHVPHSRFEEFWGLVASLLAEGGEVLFDFPDVTLPLAGHTEVPPDPVATYRFYAPEDGTSLRDLDGRRWRVVHHLWDRDELAARLRELGWEMSIVGPGQFADVVWASARR
jgi:SAM-dependent methyltransferase